MEDAERARDRADTAEELQQYYGIDDDTTLDLIDMAWRIGQSRWRHVLISYAGSDMFTIAVLTSADITRLLSRSFYAGERCLMCLRAHGKTRAYINALGYCPFGHYEHDDYESYQLHPSEYPRGPQPAFHPAPPVPQDQEGDQDPPLFRAVKLGTMAPGLVVNVCAVCDGKLVKSEEPADRPSDDGWVHDDDANDAHMPIVTSRAPSTTDMMRP